MINISRQRKINNKIKDPIAERIFYVINYIVLALIGFSTLYPFLNTVAVSMSSNRAVVSGEVLLFPVDLSFEAYIQIWKDGHVFKAMGNTVFLTVLGTLFNMIATIMCAYPLSRRVFPGKKLFMTMITITMFFGGGLIPTFILIRTMGLMDKFSALWLLSLMGTYNMIVLRTFFSKLPTELEESAQIDGANDLIILFRIALPLSKPILATLTLFYAVGWWNNYMGPLLYISSPDKTTLMMKLKQLLDASQMTQTNLAEQGIVQEIVAPETFKAASIFVSTLPILCFYPFLQKYFVKGVMIGSLKG